MRCKACKKKHDGTYKSGMFCSYACFRVYSEKKTRKRVQHTRISQRSGHEYTCEICGKESVVGYKSNTLIDNPKILCKACFESRCTACGLPKEECQSNEPDVCVHYRLTPSLINYYGFDINVIGTPGYITEYKRIRDMLYDVYWNQGMSTHEMAVLYNCSRATIHGNMKSLGINTRTPGEGLRNAIVLGKVNVPNGNDRFNKGWHTSWEGIQCYYRSGYELDYALELDEKKVPYRMEELRIPYYDTERGIERVAIPDFFLPMTNEIIEVKSDYTYDRQNMLDKFSAYKEHGYAAALCMNHVQYSRFHCP